jgi:hypothetical protein
VGCGYSLGSVGFFSCLVGLFCGLFGLSFLGFGVIFSFSVSCCGLAFGVSCVYFLYTKGRLYAFLINIFLPIEKKRKKKKKYKPFS